MTNSVELTFMDVRSDPMGGKRRRKLNEDDEHEPVLDPEDWIEWGGELYMPAGFTSGGAPYGLRLEEYLDMVEEDNPERGWARARRLLRRAFSHSPEHKPSVGRVVRVGEGLSRDIYAAHVVTGLGHLSCVVQLPRKDAPRGLALRTRREARLLAWLAARETGLRVPRPFAVLPTDHGPALVREHLQGIPADLRAGRMQGIRPWQLVAETAALIHGLPTEELDWMGGPTTREGHAVERLQNFGDPAGVEDPLLRAALGWLGQHPPSGEPASLLHGDLLGQNLLLWPGKPPGVLDWEYAGLGDPAYDLAIVTRGVRRPFQIADGFQRLLDAYNERARRPIRATEVRFHEICLLIGWCRKETMANTREQNRNKLRRVLQQAEAEELGT